MRNVPGSADGLSWRSRVLWEGGEQTKQVNSVTSNSPWAPQAEKLQVGYNQALTNLQSGSPSYFPNPTYVPASGATNQALGMTEARALAGSPLLRQAQGTAEATARGDFLNPASNPYIRDVVGAAQRPTIDAFNQVIQPGNDARFSMAGRYGSGSHVNAQTQSQDALMRNLGETASNIYGQNYANERQLQQGALSLAPQLAEADYADPARLGAVGQAREGYAGQELQDTINRYDFGQNAADNRLRQYMSLISGGTGGGTSTQSIPVTSNPWYQAAGTGIAGASALAQLYRAFQ